MPSRYEFTTQQVQQMEYAQLKGLSEKQLRAATRQLLDVAAKRYKRTEEKWGDISAAASWGKHTKGTGRVSLKGMTEAQVLKEALKAQEYLGMKTSTEKGRKEVKEKFEQNIGQDLSVDQYKRLWSIFNKVEKMAKEGYIDGYYAINYKTVIKDIANELKSSTAEGYITNAEEKINAMYKQYQLEKSKAEEELTNEDSQVYSDKKFNFEDLLI